MKIFSARRGVALIIVLSIIVMVTILVLLLSTAMRMDRSSSFYNLERTRADLLAREGVETARALLDGATTPTNRYWVSQPGRIIHRNTSGTLVTNNLSSGFSSDTNTLVSTSLNRRMLVASNDFLLHPGVTDSSQFQLRWIYVNRDGSRSDAFSTNAVGRFAFWVDDETARIDVNTAELRNSAKTLANPEQITLAAALGSGAAADVVSFRSASLQTPFEVFNLVGAANTNALFTNRFNITHLAKAPDVNPWGEPRIVLTTDRNLARGQPFLDIYGAGGLLDENALNQNVIGRLVGTNGFLLRTDWPYVPGTNFARKYYPPASTGRILQKAIDLVEYVRSVEAASTYPSPILAVPAANGLVNLVPVGTELADIPANAFLGTVRRPMISRIGVWMATNLNGNSRYDSRLHLRIETPLPTTNLWLAPRFDPVQPFPVTALPAFGAGTTDVALPFEANPVGGSRPVEVNARVAIQRANDELVGNLLEIAPLAQNLTLPVPPDDTSLTAAFVQDPRVNKLAANWVVVTNAPGTNFATLTEPTWPALPAGVPPEDGVVSPTFPTNGIVSSVGEIGYISTGVESLEATAAAPGRTWRLRPTPGATTNTLPDWALLDIFTAPINQEAIPNRLVPQTNVVAGWVNVNATLHPFSGVVRTAPLDALFTNVVSSGNLATVISNVRTRQVATDGVLYGGGSNGYYVSVGELAEIRGVADTGEAGEDTLRAVVNLATVRGNTFSVYCVGQALQVTPQGVVVVNGEKILHAMVERYWDEAAGAIRFRTVYWREMRP